MPNQKDVRQKIKTVNNIKKVTEAMETISSIRLQKATRLLMAARAYSSELFSFISTILKPFYEPGNKEAINKIKFADQRPAKNILFVVISSDRGLAGFFNSRLAAHAAEAARIEKHRGRNIDMITIGKKAADILGRRGFNIVSRYSMSESGKMGFAKKIADKCIALFMNNKYEDVFIFYNHFVSVGKQEVSAFQLLPVKVEKTFERKYIPIRHTAIFEEKAGAKYLLPDYIYEPQRMQLLDDLMGHYLETIVFQAIRESVASEHAARMIAMQQSTSNADDMIKNLTILYNKVRQALITRELIEVIGSAEALR